MKSTHLICGCLLLLLTACGERQALAPVTSAWHASMEKQGHHKVRPGETLYAIAWRYDLDYRDLAKLNHLKSPYHLNRGQTLIVDKRLVSAKMKKKQRMGINRAKKLSKKRKGLVRKSKYQRVTTWYWPTRGHVIKGFSLTKGSKGIDISGHAGQAIYAAAPGRVAYSGNGIRGYGNLLIIKHNNQYLSAYAHNRKLLVKEGDWVKAGMKIAEMGNTDVKRVKLHFEIRKSGKPVNPLRYLSH